MIYAKTGMERMPEECHKCEFRSAVTDDERACGWSYLCEITGEKPAEYASRPDWCPLREIHEPTDTKEA